MENKKSFTLVELVVVIGILAILFGIAIVAINPARQFSQANNTKRRSDVSTILNAVIQYAADNNGTLPSGISTTAKNIGSGSGDANICSDLVTRYIAEIPTDPSSGSYTDCSSYDSQYEISKSASDNRVTVSAPDAELSETISITK